MDDVIWSETDFGLHNYTVLINDAKARALEPHEDIKFVSLVKKYHSKHAAVVDWGRGSLRDVVIQNMKGDAKNCDIYFKRAVEHLSLGQNELAWVGWHDQIESIEITVGKLLEYVIPALFVGCGTVVMSTNQKWLIEYKFNDVIYAARCV
jgi:hypothetical protein